MADDWGNDPIQKVAAPATDGDWGNDPVVGTKNYKFSDDAVSSAIKNSSKVVYMHPDQYLALTPDLPSNPRSDKKGASLAKSLAKGDDVDEVPSLDVTVGNDGTAKVVDQDGRHRAQFAKDAGVDLIPVAVKRSGEKGLITHLAGMKDGSEPVPFDFKPVLPPQKTKPAATAPAAAPDKPAGLLRWDVLGDIGRSAEGAVKATGDDLKAAFPNPLTMDRGPVATAKRMGNALKAPLDAMGVVASPVTGAAHALAGSALSYFTHAFPIPGHDPKADADEGVDQAMMGLGPEGMEGGALAITAAAEARSGNALARATAVSKNKAIQKINEKMAADGLTAQQVLDAQKTANAAGDKLTLMDMGKKNVRGLAGSVYRAPGPAGTEIDEFLDARDQKVSDALTSDIHGGIAKGSTFGAMKNLFTARTAASKPAFDAAFAADSTAPFESQFEAHFNEADKAVHAASEGVRQANSDLTAIEGKAATTNDIYSAPTPAAIKAARQKVSGAEEALEAANSQKEMIRTKLQQAQADKTANAPGAIWSPRLQEFMDNPEVQSGLKKALKLEKQDAVSERRPFKDSDFGIVGTDAEGEPVIGAVPTMKSLAVAKEGLDARIADLKDPNTGRPTKAGLSLKKFRDEFVKELYRLNPKYKTAVDAWSGPSQSVDAIKDGKTHFSRPESNEEVKSDFDALTSSDKEFYRLGAAEAKIDSVERTADAGDKTKKVINSERDRKRFRMLFNSGAEADKFIASVERKRQMFDTRTDIKGNSKTAQRQAEDESDNLAPGLHLAHGAANAVAGNWLGAVTSLVRAKKDLGLLNDPAFNSHIARILTDPNLAVAPSGGLALLNKTPLPGVQNQLAKGIFRAAHVNGLRSLNTNALRSMLSGQNPQPPQAQ